YGNYKWANANEMHASRYRQAHPRNSKEVGCYAKGAGLDVRHWAQIRNRSRKRQRDLRDRQSIDRRANPRHQDYVNAPSGSPERRRIAMVKTLDVYLHDELVGHLIQDDGGQTIFEYAE